jgi:hypothetical protein
VDEQWICQSLTALLSVSVGGLASIQTLENPLSGGLSAVISQSRQNHHDYYRDTYLIPSSWRVTDLAVFQKAWMLLNGSEPLYPSGVSKGGQARLLPAQRNSCMW